MKPKKITVTQEFLKEVFEYKDGKLFWKKRISIRCVLGKEAGDVKDHGYRHVGVSKKRYLAHRLIYFMFYGEQPQEIDHIDGNRDNNKIENLRSVTRSQNNMNSKMNRRNKTGHKGVRKNIHKWVASLGQKHIGSFDTKEEASEAYYKEACKRFGTEHVRKHKNR